MNRIAGRAWIALILVFALIGGMFFFLAEYLVKSEDWVLFSGSPHVYSNGKLADGMVLDRNGALLLDLSDGKTYAPNEELRKAMLHWVGDRQGNIRTAMLAEYAKEMVGFDRLNGVYTYAESPGRIQLTLSSQVQLAAAKALEGYRGSIAVYNYQTGEMICAVSAPNFDPENVPDIAGDTEGIYEGVYVNRFLQSAYTPGSIFKIATLAAAVECVPDILEHTFTCTGLYEIGTGDVSCEAAHGMQTLKETFANSCNCGFAQIVELIGAEKLARCMEQFGITDPVRFDGITTAKGNFDLSNAYGELLAWSGIGQHTDQVNPCAYMTFVGAIAAGGNGVNPHVVAQIRVGDNATYTAKTAKRERIMSQSTAVLLQDYMRNNVQSVYGDEHFPGLTVCAKTGTGEVGGDKKPNATMTGFVADEKYPFAFMIVVEEGGYGGVTCKPMIASVLAACKEMVDSAS